MTDEKPIVTDGSYVPPPTPEQYSRLAKENDKLRRSLRTQQRRLEDTLAAFLAYGKHTEDCDGGDGDSCDCGYTEAWRKCLRLERTT